MSLKNVWEVCEFRDEIKFGKLDRKMFAVELYEVLSGDADEIYLNPEKFLENTHLTIDMRMLLGSALKRLARNEGNAVYVLDTEFGGGKTHTLLMLYHIFRNRDLGTKYIREHELDKEYGVLEVPEVRVVAIDCRRMEKDTLWGEIAHSLGKYELMKDYDLKKVPPENIDKIRALFDSPTLILIDELPIYLVNAEAIRIGDTNLMKLTLNFLTVLVSAVSTSNRTMLVLTLTGKQRLYENAVKGVKDRVVEEVHDYFTSSVSRQAQYLVPVRGEEIYQVLRKRLIKSLNESEMRRVVDAYYKYYSEKGLVSEVDYKRKMEMAYPFHPFLIDVLHERVSTIEKFNKTRGVLWLLSAVLHRIYMERKDCKLVTTGDIPLEDATIRDALTSQLDKSAYVSAINTDVIEKAKHIDERRNVGIAQRIARTIYLYSLIAATKIPGIKPSEIKLAVCRIGEDPDVVDDILQEMEKEFWYLRKDGNEYYFWIEPGINKVIDDYRKEVTDEEMRNKVLNTLKSMFKDTQHAKIIWGPDKLDDSEDLRIFVSLSPLSKIEIEKMLDTIPTGKPTGKLRIYKNTLVFVFPDEHMLEEVRKYAREVCAIEKAKEDARIKGDKTMVRELENRLESAKKELRASCENAFTKIAYPKVGSGEIDPEEIQLFDDKVKKSENLTERVISFLNRKGKFRDSLSVDSIVDIAPVKKQLDEKGYVNVEEIYKAFKQDRRLPFISSGEAIINAIKKGVESAKFGYAGELKEINGKYEAVIGESVQVDWEGYIIRKDLVSKPEPSPPGSVESTEPTSRGAVAVDVGTGYKSPPYAPSVLVPKQYQYRVHGSIDDLEKLLKVIRIVKIERVKLNLSVSIHAGGDKISIQSALSDVDKLIKLVGKIKEVYPQDKVEVESNITADKDISGELIEYGIDFEEG